MKTFEKEMNLGIQGDVCFQRVDALPEGLELAKADKGKIVVAHSETGHDHAFLSTKGVELLEDPNDPLKAYLKIDEDADLNHLRGYDPHETVKFTPGIYRVNRQKEHTPEGFRQVQD